MAEAFDERDWSHSKQYTTNANDFVSKIEGSVRELTQDDREMWQRFVERNSTEGLVVKGAGGSGSGVRDFKFMCIGLPVNYYAAIEDGEMVGFLSVNPQTDVCDEISALFVEPAHRRKGIAHSLLSVATEAIFYRGRVPGYYAGGAPGRLDKMLKGIGYHLNSDVWSCHHWD